MSSQNSSQLNSSSSAHPLPSKPPVNYQNYSQPWQPQLQAGSGSDSIVSRGFQPSQSQASMVSYPSRTLYNAQPTSSSYQAQTTYQPSPVATYRPPYQPAYQQQPQQPQNQYFQSQQQPQIIENPFAPPIIQSSVQAHRPTDRAYDYTEEALIAHWQSAYAPKEEAVPNPLDSPTTETPPTATIKPTAPTALPTDPTQDGQEKTVIRSGGGKTWQDSTLLEWNPSDHRLFLGNLAGEVTDESIRKAFAKYESVQKTRVIRDQRTNKSKGYGFVSFTDSDDYFTAAREMQGKYIGSHPILIKRSKTEIKPTVPKSKYNKNKNKNKNNQDKAQLPKLNTPYAGIQKLPKTKGGLKLLG